MSDDDRSIELEIEVPGTPEEVWRAVATGPGVSSWYVPHEIEEREGGDARASFGPGMDVDGRVATWDPPHRIVFDGGGEGGGFAFEWTVEARGEGTCVVRLVNSGFGTGEEWDDQYDGMAEGWRLFLANLRLHLEHFAGQSGRAMLPMAELDVARDAGWALLQGALGIGTDHRPGERIEVTAEAAPTLAGTVVDVAPNRVTVIVEAPAPGTAFVAAEGRGDTTTVSVWSYLYGPDADAIVERDDPTWRKWLADLG